MRNLLSDLGKSVLGLCVIGIGLGGSALAQVTANGPYYATPSWDQTLPSATRFIVLSNFNSEAVLDRNTGLVWERSPATATTTWTSARFICATKIVGGQMGWRLPSFVELASLIDRSVASGPMLQPGHPFTNVQVANYWSATTLADLPLNAWFAGFGGVVGAGGKTISNPVWCVRGGMNADQY